MTTKRQRQIAVFKALLDAALAAGRKAGDDCTPTPMRFFQAGEPPASGTVEMEGNCGVAWVTVFPGGSPFVRWVKSIADTDDRFSFQKAYYGGYSIWPRGFGQSHDRKVAWAGAVARVLSDGGLSATADDRLV